MVTQHAEIAGKAERFRKLYTAAVHDIMDDMCLPNQCMDLGIRALDRSMRIAGPAEILTIENRSRNEIRTGMGAIDSEGTLPQSYIMKWQ